MKINTAAVAFLVALAAAPTERNVNAFGLNTHGPASAGARVVRRRAFASASSSSTTELYATQVRFRHAFESASSTRTRTRTRTRSTNEEQGTLVYSYDVSFPEGDKAIGVPSDVLDGGSHGGRPLMKMDGEERNHLCVGARVEVNFRAGVISKVRVTEREKKETLPPPAAAAPPVDGANGDTTAAGDGDGTGFVVDAVRAAPAAQQEDDYDDELVTAGAGMSDPAADGEAFAAFAAKAESELKEVNEAATFEPPPPTPIIATSPAPLSAPADDNTAVLSDQMAEAKTELRRLDAEAARLEKRVEASAGANKEDIGVGGGIGGATTAVDAEAYAAFAAEAETELEKVRAAQFAPEAESETKHVDVVAEAFDPLMALPPPVKKSRVPAAPKETSGEEEGATATIMPAAGSYLDGLRATAAATAPSWLERSKNAVPSYPTSGEEGGATTTIVPAAGSYLDGLQATAAATTPSWLERTKPSVPSYLDDLQAARPESQLQQPDVTPQEGAVAAAGSDIVVGGEEAAQKEEAVEVAAVGGDAISEETPPAIMVAEAEEAPPPADNAAIGMPALGDKAPQTFQAPLTKSGGETTTMPTTGSYLDDLHATPSTTRKANVVMSSYLDGLHDADMPKNAGGATGKTGEAAGGRPASSSSYLDGLAPADLDRLARLDAKVDLLSRAQESLRGALRASADDDSHRNVLIDPETMEKVHLLGKAEDSLKIAIERARASSKMIVAETADRVERALDSTIAKIEEIRRRYDDL